MKIYLALTLVLASISFNTAGASERISETSSYILNEKRLKVSFYFGSEDGASDEQASVSIQNFIEKIVRDLPGATIIKGRGYWDNGTQIASEPSWIVISLVPVSDEAKAMISSIAHQYAKEYKQYAVSWDTQEVDYSRLVTLSH